jgi:hypothetical protein
MPDPFADIPAAPAAADPFADIPDAPNPFADVPDSSATIAQRIDSDVTYTPSREEFRTYREFNANKTTKLSDAPGIAGQAAGHLATKLWETAKAVPDAVLTRTPLNSAVQSLLEAGSRGTADLGRSARPLIDSIASQFADESREKFARRFLAETLRIAPEAVRLPPGAALSPAARPINRSRDEFDNYDRALLRRLDTAYDDYKLDRDFERFQVNRSLDQVRAEAAAGQGDMAPITVGEPSQKFAEAAAPFLDVSTAATFGAGAIAEQALKAAGRTAAADALGAAARTAGTAGRVATAAGKAPENIAAGLTRAVTGSETAAELARKTVSGGGATLAVAPGVGVSIPGVTEVAQAATAAKVAGTTLDAAAQAAAAAGRAAAAGPTRVGFFERISKDGAAPLWLRKAAGTAMVLDPAAEAAAGLAGVAGRGALGGATAGGALGYTLSAGDPEAAYAGAGGGAMAGSLGGLVNRVVTQRARNIADGDADLARWLAGKTVDEVANIGSLRLTREQALKVSDVERWARGVLNEEGGDVQFRYLSDAEFKKQFGSSQKGAEIIQGDKPVVFVNTGYRGARSLFHEVFHAIDDLDAFDPQRIELNRGLFTETTPDGTVLNQGAFDAADLAAFEQSYRQRLGPDARAQWDAQPAAERFARIRKEVRAESFASMVTGATGQEVLTGASGWRRRLADSMLLADHASTLGRMRRFLEAAGVEFKATGDPSELFFKNGRPLTNTPEVDAALRDYMRAKRRVVDRLVAGDDETPATVFDEHAIRASPKLARALAAQHPDWDGWQKNPDGSVKFFAGIPVLATRAEMTRIQLNRVEGMMAALQSVPDLGASGIVRDEGNGHWKGKRFSAAQLEALMALPDDVLSPSMKQRIAQLNDLVGSGSGQQIVIDYNAALKGKRYSSALSPSTRIVVPISFDISKAGNFLMDTLDVTHFMRKLGDWQSGKPHAFDAWGGDVNALMADVFKYLDNHRLGLPGATDLHPDAATAIVKRNVIKDLFNVGGPGALSETGGSPISGKGGKDNLIRSRRFDRIQRITPGEGSPFPIDYYRQKANFMLRVGPNDVPVTTLGMKHTEEAKAKMVAAQQRRWALAKATPTERTAMLRAEEGQRRAEEVKRAEERRAKQRASQSARWAGPGAEEARARMSESQRNSSKSQEHREKLNAANARQRFLETATPEERMALLQEEFQARLEAANQPRSPEYYAAITRRAQAKQEAKQEALHAQQQEEHRATLDATWDSNRSRAFDEIDPAPRRTPGRAVQLSNYIDVAGMDPERAATLHAQGPGHVRANQTYQRTYFHDTQTGEIVGVGTYSNSSFGKRVAHIGALPGHTRGESLGKTLKAFLSDGRFQPVAAVRLRNPINARDPKTIVRFPDMGSFEAEVAAPASEGVAEAKSHLQSLPEVGYDFTDDTSVAVPVQKPAEVREPFSHEDAVVLHDQMVGLNAQTDAPDLWRAVSHGEGQNALAKLMDALQIDPANETEALIAADRLRHILLKAHGLAEARGAVDPQGRHQAFGRSLLQGIHEAGSGSAAGNPSLGKFLPAAHPAEVVRVTRDQAIADFTRELGIPYGAGATHAAAAFERLRGFQPSRMDERARATAAAAGLRSLVEREREALQQAIITGGLNGARALLDQKLKEEMGLAR